MKRSEPDAPRPLEMIHLPGFTHSALAEMVADAGVIMDGELDDDVALRLARNRGQWLAVYTPDKDGHGVAPKARMLAAVAGRRADYELWMRNDHTKSDKENRVANRDLLDGGHGLIVREFAEGLRPAFDKWGFVPLVVTAPTFGIVDRIHQCLGGRPIVAVIYSGSYNLRHMYDLVALSKARVGGAYIVDTSAFHALGGGGDPRLARLANFRALFAGTDFWAQLEARQPGRFLAIRKFLLHFNTELVRPGRLLLPEYLATKAAELEGEYEAIFWRGEGTVALPQLAQYLLTVSTKYDPYIKPFKRAMVQGTEALMSDAAMCDLLIGALCHLDPALVEWTYGEWVVDRFARVDPEGARTNAMTWRLRCTRPGATDAEAQAAVDRIAELVRGALLED